MNSQKKSDRKNKKVIFGSLILCCLVLLALYFILFFDNRCSYPQKWSNGLQTCVYPVHVKVSGTNKLQIGCITWKDQCWRDAVDSGVVKFIETKAVTTGVNTRPIAFAYFYNGTTPSPSTGQYSYTIFYADTGEPFSNDINRGVKDEIDWVIGNEKGLILHLKNKDICYETSWYPMTKEKGVSSNIWTNKKVECN
mgnify:FL=1